MEDFDKNEIAFLLHQPCILDLLASTPEDIEFAEIFAAADPSIEAGIKRFDWDVTKYGTAGALAGAFLPTALATPAMIYGIYKANRARQLAETLLDMKVENEFVERMTLLAARSFHSVFGNLNMRSVREREEMLGNLAAPHLSKFGIILKDTAPLHDVDENLLKGHIAQSVLILAESLLDEMYDRPPEARQTSDDIALSLGIISATMMSKAQVFRLE